jgi:hypothetical protein
VFTMIDVSAGLSIVRETSASLSEQGQPYCPFLMARAIVLVSDSC